MNHRILKWIEHLTAILKCTYSHVFTQSNKFSLFCCCCCIWLAKCILFCAMCSFYRDNKFSDFPVCESLVNFGCACDSSLHANYEPYILCSKFYVTQFMVHFITFLLTKANCHCGSSKWLIILENHAKRMLNKCIQIHKRAHTQALNKNWVRNYSAI